MFVDGPDMFVMAIRKQRRMQEKLKLEMDAANMISMIIRPMNSSPIELVFQMNYRPWSFDIKTNARSW